MLAAVSPATLLFGRDGKAICVCIVASFIAHAVFFAYAPVTSATVESFTLVDSSSTSLRARLMYRQPATSSARSERTTETSGQPTAPITQTEQPKPEPRSLTAPTAATRPLSASVESRTPSLSPPGMTSQLGDLDGYLPRPLLTQAPVLRTPVEIPPPPRIDGEHPNGQRFIGVLSLFIDENGEVRHIAADTTPLPVELEQAARKSFLAARFIPGLRDGRVVKSRLRVEIVFDTSVEPAAAED